MHKYTNRRCYSAYDDGAVSFALLGHWDGLCVLLDTLLLRVFENNPGNYYPQSPLLPAFPPFPTLDFLIFHEGNRLFTG